MDTIEQMKLFMEPRSIAVIGASRRTGENSFNIFENMLNFGFHGKLYPVTPTIDEILGIKAYPSVKDIPEDVDLAVITTPYPLVLNLVKQCIDKGIKAIVVVSGGFADAGDQGKSLQAEIMKVAKEGDARIIGPNSLGVANVSNKLNTGFVPHLEMETTSIGVVSQSGVFFPGLPRLLLAGKAIDLANCCDIDYAECLEYFEDDPETKLILLHIEGIKDGRQFMNIARRVVKKKPILALKTGRSEQGLKTAQSHTGAMAGRDEVYDAAFKQCGIIRVDDIDEIQDVAKALLNLPPMKGRRIAMATVAYGAAVMGVDACQQYNLEVARLSPKTLAKISELAPSWLSIINPVDLGGLTFLSVGLNRTLSTVLTALLSDEQVNAMLLFCPAMAQDLWGCLEVVPEMAERFKDKPIVCSFYGNYLDEFAAKLEETKRVAVFPTLERAIRALARLRQYSEIKGAS